MVWMRRQRPASLAGLSICCVTSELTFSNHLSRNSTPFLCWSWNSFSDTWNTVSRSLCWWSSARVEFKLSFTWDFFRWWSINELNNESSILEAVALWAPSLNGLFQFHWFLFSFLFATSSESQVSSIPPHRPIFAAKNCLRFIFFFKKKTPLVYRYT